MTTSLDLQRDLCRAVEATLGQPRIKELHEKSAAHTLLTLLHLWLAIVVAFFLAAQVFDLPLAWAIVAGVALAAFMSTRINALNVLVHEGSHYCLATGRKTNAFLTNWGAGYWIGYDEDSYRSVHGRHHQFLNERDDPDLPLYSLGRSRGRILVDLLSDLFWITLVRRVLTYKKMAAVRSREGAPRLVHLLGKVIANSILLGALVALNGTERGVLVYFLFWIAPLFSLYPMIIRMRVITEHFAPEVVDPTAAPVFVARTSICGPVEHYLFGAQMDFHFEHHLFPGVPYRELRRMHSELDAAGFFSSDGVAVVDHSLSGGYFRFWWRLLRSDFFDGSRARAEAAT